jgi:hypothetical protein
MVCQFRSESVDGEEMDMLFSHFLNQWFMVKPDYRNPSPSARVALTGW